MKKLILLLLLFTVNLFSQEHEYWKKIDFEFDSGIKHISIYYVWDADYAYNKIPFLVSTENNYIYYFENIESKGINLNFPDSLNIQKMMFFEDGGVQSYYVMADSILFYYDLSMSKWKKYRLPDSVDKIIDFTAAPFRILHPYQFVLLSDKFVPYFKIWTRWEKNSDILNDERIIKFKSTRNNNYIMSLTDKKNIYVFDRNDSEWSHFGTIDSTIAINDFTTFRSYEGIYTYYIDGNNTFNCHFFNDYDSLSKLYSLLIDHPVSSFLNISPYNIKTGLPNNVSCLVGTDGGGVHFVNDYDSEFEIAENDTQLHEKKIIDIKVNKYSDPDLCLLATDDREVYWGFWAKPNAINDKKTKSSLTVFPNPARDYIEITLSQHHRTNPMVQSEEIEIFDVLGKSVLRNTPSSLRDVTPLLEGNNRLDISNLQPGIYFVQVGSEFLKFVKM